VVFVEAADHLAVAPAEELSLSLDGPEGDALRAEPDNLVLRAARLLAEAAGLPARAAMTLTKRLPVASGIGGGSADAAAALRALDRLWGLGWDEARLAPLALRLGADIPACLRSRPVRMGGIGEVLAPAPLMPDCGIVLANPRIAVATPAVFKARQGGFSPAAALPEGWRDATAMVEDLRRLRNELEPPALALCPAIAEVLATMRALPGCLLARMSGSGATCFGLFGSPEAATAAARLLPSAWWRWGGGLHGAATGRV
jgi:4-diphosphocytidyl-2-C-methyl-D-erythritol kinase